jgi:hypothetical protein
MPDRRVSQSGGASNDAWPYRTSHSRRSRTMKSVEFDEVCHVPADAE